MMVAVLAEWGAAATVSVVAVVRQLEGRRGRWIRRRAVRWWLLWPEEAEFGGGSGAGGAAVACLRFCFAAACTCVVYLQHKWVFFQATSN
jgi:hypothetical protein